MSASPLQVREYKHGLKRGDKIAHITHVICIRCGHSFVLSPYEHDENNDEVPDEEPDEASAEQVENPDEIKTESADEIPEISSIDNTLEEYVAGSYRYVLFTGGLMFVKTRANNPGDGVCDLRKVFSLSI